MTETAYYDNRRRTCGTVQYSTVVLLQLLLYLPTPLTTRAYRYLRGQFKPEPDGGPSNISARRSHLELYRRIRRETLALWYEASGSSGAATDAHVNNEAEFSSDDGEGRIPCFLWYSGSWRYATASWYDHLKEKLKVMERLP